MLVITQTDLIRVIYFWHELLKIWDHFVALEH